MKYFKLIIECVQYLQCFRYYFFSPIDFSKSTTVLHIAIRHKSVRSHHKESALVDEIDRQLVLWLVFLLMGDLSFFGLSIYDILLMGNTCFMPFVISFALVLSMFYKLQV